jgi:hypothetical protein
MDYFIQYVAFQHNHYIMNFYNSLYLSEGVIVAPFRGKTSRLFTSVPFRAHLWKDCQLRNMNLYLLGCIIAIVFGICRSKLTYFIFL